MARILLVEDDAELSGTLKLVLSSHKHQITTVLTGFEGLEQMRFGEYDAIILDGMLPDMDGLQVCKAYRADGGTAPILMLTGRAESASVRAGFDAGVNAYLKKPFGVRELLESIQNLVGKENPV